jgi:ABC-type amino acid transport substrate-binding protein
MSDRRPPATARERREAERRDRDLAPYDRGPVKAFIRDEVDARRRLVGAFLPVLGIVIIAAVNPASDWQRYALYAGLVALAAVVVDAVVMGVTITRAARAAFPDESVPLLATGWYAFLRAHRSRAKRRPPPKVAPRGRPVSGAR